MFARTPLSLNGQPVGRFRAGWILLKETWRFMMLDKELLWVPVISLFLNLFFFGVIITIAVLVALSLEAEVPENSPIWLAFLFLTYVVGAFIIAFSQAVISHIVYVRAHGGDAGLGQGITRALAHSPSLFMWSLITSTVGLILQVIAERSEMLGRIVSWVLGAAWRVLTYFVVPAMIIDNVSAFTAIPKSATVFKQTFGETAVSNISYNLILTLAFALVLASGAGLVIAALAYEMNVLALFILFIFIGLIVLLSLVASVLGGILKTLLYIYAAEGSVPNNFNHELLEKMMFRRTLAPPPLSAVPPAQTLV